MEENKYLQAALQNLGQTPTERRILPLLLMNYDEVEQLLTAIFSHRVRADGKDFKCDDFTKNNLKIASKWLYGGSKTFLVLYGTYGTGKTTLIESIRQFYRTYKEVKEREIRDSGGVSWLTPEKDKQLHQLEIHTPREIEYYMATDLTDIILAENDKKSPKFDGICKSRFLVVDEFGREPKTVKNYGNDTTPLATLINIRDKLGLPTILATNMQMGEIQQMYTDYVFDRLLGAGAFIHYEQKSYRHK